MPISPDQNQANKTLIWDLWRQLDNADVSDLPAALSGAFHDDVNWNGPQPINHLDGVDGVMDGFWAPLRESFPDIKRDTRIFLGGSSGDEEWVSGMGYLTGTFVNNWLGIPASGETTNIHFGQFYAMQDSKVAESYLILDVVAVMRQAGYDVLPPSRGAIGGKVPGPATRDGVQLSENDPLETRKTAQLVGAMGDGLRRYVRNRDGSDLSSMRQQEFWHPDMHWYGPTGIGTCFSLAEFEDFHQKPWLRAFGDRNVPSDPGRAIGLADGDILAEGRYAALGVWDAPFSMNYDDFLGVPATGMMTKMRDFDWYRVGNGRIAENWVPLDVVDILLQLDVDVFALLQRQVEERRAKRWFE